HITISCRTATRVNPSGGKTSRPFRMVRKLSKDSSKSGGNTLMLSSRIPAPMLVTSRKLQPNTPRRELKNSKALFAIFVLPSDLRSLRMFISVLDELLVDPTAAVMAAPDFPVKQSPRDRAPRNDNGP